MIRVEHLTKKFDDKVVLKDITTRFEPGKVNLVIGMSGSGKTVFMKCLLGLLIPEKGELYFGDKNFYSLSEKEQKLIRKEMGVVFQSGAIFDFLDVEGNVKFPLDMFTNMSNKEKLERVNFCLERVNLQGTNKLKPPELSGGMKKRLAIARAIALNPKYLFCDEPNSGLDPQNAVLIDELISDLTHEFNTTTVVNTHDMNSVIKIGEKVIFFYNGMLWWEGSKDNIFETDNQELKDFIFASSLAQKLLESL